ncbi:MAG: 4Fe-4S binding protein [Candidatus Kaelpia aquatica]|nr:4Fe-4S binding protein [Candidatus Kaelpia aquatica]
MKRTQKIMIWFLPIIVVGGLFYPLLGYLVVAMMVALLTLSFFKKRYWCWNICPRGAFLDGVMSKVSRKKPIPKLFTKQWFRLVILFIFISIAVYCMINAGGDILAIGAVFVSICLITTVIAIIMAVITKPRAWCSICPMGTLQDKISKIGM